MTLTKTELKTIAATASKICGCLWDDVDAVGTVAKLQAVLATACHGGDFGLTSYDRHALEVLLSVTDEAVYMLLDADTNDDIRDATIEELCDSLLAGPEGVIEVDGIRCYAETAVSY